MSTSSVRAAGASTPGTTAARPLDAPGAPRARRDEAVLAHTWLEMSANTPLVGLLDVPANVAILAADADDGTTCWVRGNGQRTMRQDLAGAFLAMGFEVEQPRHDAEGGPLAGPWMLRLRPPLDAGKAAGTLAAHGEVRVARWSQGTFNIRSPAAVTVEPFVQWRGRVTGRAIHIGEGAQLDQAVSCPMELDVGRGVVVRGPVRCGVLRLAPGAHLAGGIRVVAADQAQPVVVAGHAHAPTAPPEPSPTAWREAEIEATPDPMPPLPPFEEALVAPTPQERPRLSERMVAAKPAEALAPPERPLQDEDAILVFQDTVPPPGPKQDPHDPGEPPWAMRPENALSAILHFDPAATRRLLDAADWLDDWSPDDLRKDGLEFDARAGRHQALFGVRELGTPETHDVARPFPEVDEGDALLTIMAQVPRDVRLRGRVIEGALHLKVLASKADSLTSTLGLFFTGAGLANPDAGLETARRGDDGNVRGGAG